MTIGICIYDNEVKQNCFYDVYYGKVYQNVIENVKLL